MHREILTITKMYLLPLRHYEKSSKMSIILKGIHSVLKSGTVACMHVMIGYYFLLISHSIQQSAHATTSYHITYQQKLNLNVSKVQVELTDEQILWIDECLRNDIFFVCVRISGALDIRSIKAFVTGSSTCSSCSSSIEYLPIHEATLLLTLSSESEFANLLIFIAIGRTTSSLCHWLFGLSSMGRQYYRICIRQYNQVSEPC